MTIDELAQEAIEVVNSGGEYVFVEYPETGMTQRYLAGQKSPQGRVIETHPGGVTVRYNAMSVLIWCATSGAKIVIVPPGKAAKEAATE